MNRLGVKISNLLEYFGVESSHYYHRRASISYDPLNRSPYYLDFSNRADYAGPFDDRIVPLYDNGSKKDYLPAAICLFALGNWQLHIRAEDDTDRLKHVIRCAGWLLDNQDDSGRWLSPFDHPRFNLKAPFPSAMSQGLGISCLVRAHDVTGNQAFLDSAVMALKPFSVAIKEGGVASFDQGRIFYEEYPGLPYRHVLNGFIYALWGLHDLYRFAGNTAANAFFGDGLATLIEWLPRYDLGFWSLYHIPDKPPNPATVHYHRLHIDQMQIMHQITGIKVFADYALKWRNCLKNKINGIRVIPAKIRWDLSK